MSIEENKRIVEELCEAVRTRDVDRLSKLATSDVTWWVAPSTISSGTLNREQWLGSMAEMFENAAAPFEVTIHELTAEDDRVSATIQGRMQLKNGKTYRPDNHFLFWFRDGKISACKEYLDTYHFGLLFGFPETAAAV
jgi:uncharacterized protein